MGPGAVGEDQMVEELVAGGSSDVPAAVDLYWIPLGAGSPLVQASGRAFEALSAWRQRRPRCALFHAALQVKMGEERFTIEQAPVPDGNGVARGVVAEGPVGARAAGRLRVFRYEVRCWRDGTIPDVHAAVDSPVRLSSDAEVGARIVGSLPMVPTLVWGRDEAGADDMWNSNSVISWVLTRSGVDAESLEPPSHGRAPGWRSGLIVAAGASPSTIGRCV